MLVLNTCGMRGLDSVLFAIIDAMKKALVPLADGFEDIEAVAVIDVLRRGGIEVVTASLSQGSSSLSAHGIRMQTDAVLDDVLADHWDAIILPGGGQGTANLMACEPLIERLRAQKESGGYICAICAAPTVLAAAGVIEDEDVTCYPTCAPEMKCPVVDAPAVADRQIITGRGPGSAIIFAFAVLMHLAGEDVAHKVAEGMVTVI
jgi:4-methyl-5(b-hydroxyethyl)-thiazole monophosphate biosynthesis